MIIYIPLLNEGTKVYRPTFGELVEEGLFRVLPAENYDPLDESWAYIPGTIVKCENKTFDGKTVLIASQEISK